MAVTSILPTNQSITQTCVLPDLFAHERSLQTTSLDEALAECQTSFRYSRSNIAVDQISLDEHLTLGFKGERYCLTEKAFDDLCKIVQVPTSFAKAIPVDLIATIVERLKRLHQQTVVIIHCDDRVVGVVDPAKWTHTRVKVKERRPNYQPVNNAQILHMIQNLWTGGDQSPRITIADSGLQVELIDEQLSIEPQVGDITRVGMVIISSETGGPMPQARGYTLRLVCTNGATAPTRFGLLRFETDWRVNFDLRLVAFEANLGSFAINMSLLADAYARLIVEPVSDHLFYNLYRQARYIYRHAPGGEMMADNTLGVNSDQRRDIITRVRQRQAQLRDFGAAVIEPPQSTDILAWDLFNTITAVARHETYQRRVALERLAGDVIEGFLPVQPN